MKSFDKFLEEMKKIDGNLITEEVINELTEIFNAAVDVRAIELKNELKEEMIKEAKELKEEELNEARELRDEIITDAEEYKTKLINTMDTFLEETVNKFFEKYEENVEDDIKLVFYENFYQHVREGLEKYNFEVSETDIDVISSMKKKLEEKDEIINSKTSEVYQLKENVLAEKVKVILNKKTKDMTEMERIKLYNLVEDVKFENEDDAERKLNLFIEKFQDVDMSNDDNDDKNKEMSFNRTYDKKRILKKELNENEIAKKWANSI